MEVHKDSAGNVWEFRVPSCKCEKDPNELVELTLTVPKLSPEQQKALYELDEQCRQQSERITTCISKVVTSYEKELWEKHPELKGRTLNEIGLQPSLVFHEDKMQIEFKPL